MTAPERRSGAARADVRALAERALELVESAGDAQTQVTVSAERSMTLRFARSAPTQATAVEDMEVDVVVVVDGHVASASTNALNDAAIATAGRNALAAARAAARAGAGAYPGLPPAGATAPHAGHDADTARLDPVAAARSLAEVFAVAAAAELEAFGIWTAGEVRSAIASSAGVRVSDQVTDAHIKVICRAPDGRSGYAAATASASGALDGEAIARRAAGKVAAGAARELPPGEYTVVLEHDAVGVLLDFLGWLAFNGLAHAEGRGALSGRLGSAIAAPQINLADSPRLAGTLSRSFDAEGVAKVPLALIEDGVARAVVHDTRSAARAGAGAHSTGHALAPGGAADGPAPTNLVLAGGGAQTLEELIAPVERGIYVTRLWYVNPVDPQRTLLTGMTRDGTFLIEGGELVAPLRDLRFTDSALRLLAATEDLTCDQRLVSEAEFYGRRFATATLCPALRAHGLRVTGATA